MEYNAGKWDTPMGCIEGGWNQIQFKKECDLKVPFVFVTDRNLVFHCLRAAYTLIKYKKPGYNMAVIVYVSGDFGTPDGNIPAECRFMDSMDPECAFRMSVFPKDILDRLTKLNSFTGRLPWTCGRWFVPYLVKGPDAAFYVDSDIMFIGDVVNLLEDKGIRLDGNLPIVSASSDEFSDGSVLPVDYRNAGFLLLNLKKCISDGFTEKLEAAMPDYQYGCLDQECLNAVYKDELLKVKLPKFVNFTVTKFGDLSYEDERRIVGLHFTGEKKYGNDGFEYRSPFSHRFIYESWIYESEIEKFKGMS